MTGSSKKIVITSTLFGIISVGFIMLALYPLFKGIQKSSKGFVVAKNDLQALEDKSLNFEKAKELHNTFGISLEKIDKLFLNPEAPLDFISFLENNIRASESQVDISPTISSKSKDHPWSIMGFQISFADSFPNVIKFLQKMESSPYLIEIQNITVKKLSEQELKSEKYKKLPAGAVNLNLSLVVYIKDEN